MSDISPDTVVELWGKTAFDAWTDEDAAVFVRIKAEHPREYELVKQAFMVGFAMGGGAAIGPNSDEFLDALLDLK